jgi:hypothetical protein
MQALSERAPLAAGGEVSEHWVALAIAECSSGGR